jgi:hypothetical protein
MAARKNRRTGRYTKSTTTRRRKSKSKTNLTNLAVSGLVLNAVSNNVAGIGIYDFLTAGTSMNPSRGMSGWAVSGDRHHNIITLRELFAGKQTSGQSINDAVIQNLKANWLPMTVAVVGIPLVANVATKLLRKPVILPANRMLKSVGLKDVKL